MDMKNTETSGWIVSLWIDTSQIRLNDRAGQPYLSWSPYDRVTIDEIGNFSDFFADNNSLNWNGTVQRLHLVPIGKCNWKPGNDRLITIDGAGNSYGIYCIITARFKTIFSDVKDVENRVRKKLMVHVADKDIQWQEFRSLGAEDFVGIFLANNIADLAEIMDYIKQITYTEKMNQKKNVFDSVYSFLGLNIPDFCQEPKANLLIKFYLKAGVTREVALKHLQESFNETFKDDVPAFSSRQIVSGRGFLEIEISNHEKILSCFHNNPKAIFNGQSDFYKKHFESSRTYWYISSNNTWIVSDDDIGMIDTCEEMDVKNERFSHTNMHPISKFILMEYERMINSHRCLWWKSILKYQYNVYAKFVEMYTKENNETALCSLNNNVQTFLLHINQATALNYEVPYHNYYYTGSYNDVLKMYYGIIASIFNIAYKLPRESGSHQYEIAYCVDFESATEVHSVMYTLNNSTERFVVFHLPYDAFMHFDKTVRLLLHEVFHYIAPYSRRNRNFVFLECWMVIIFEQYLGCLERKGLKERNSKVITDYFYEYFNDFCEVIEREIDKSFYDIILNDFIMLSDGTLWEGQTAL